MTVQAWPFLMGRTVNTGHRVVVSPGFVVDAPAGDPLARIAVHPGLPDGRACVHELRGLRTGPATAVYRTFVATGARFGIGESGEDGPLRDRGGRQILLTEGVVLPVSRRRGLRIGLTEADLSRAHDALVPVYQRFWREEDRFPFGVTSVAFPVGGTAGTPLSLHDHRRPAIAQPRITRLVAKLWHPATLGAAGSAIVLGTVGAWAIGNTPDVPSGPVETSTPTSTERPAPTRPPGSKHWKCLLIHEPSQRLPYC